MEREKNQEVKKYLFLTDNDTESDTEISHGFHLSVVGWSYTGQLL